MQYLVVYGASVVAADFQRRTPAQYATHETNPALAEWLNQRRVWLAAASGCCWVPAVQRYSKQPSCSGRARSTQTTQLATSNAKPTALLWRDAPQIRRATPVCVSTPVALPAKGPKANGTLNGCNFSGVSLSPPPRKRNTATDESPIRVRFAFLLSHVIYLEIVSYKKKKMKKKRESKSKKRGGEREPQRQRASRGASMS